MDPVLTVAAFDGIDPRNAPVPTNRGERLLFAQLYDTLVRIDCEGRPAPALAVSWSASPDGRSWSFHLRDDVRFGDGAPLDARTAAASLSRASYAPSLAGVSATGASVLHVQLHDPQRDVAYFAQPALALTGARDGAGWPEGTGPYRVEPDGRALRLVRRQPTEGVPDTLRIVAVDDGDPRSALDSGVDLLVTGDAATVAYARLLDGYVTVALPWDRTYALVSAGGTGAAAPSAAERAALARDAAPIGTRPASDAAFSCAREENSQANTIMQRAAPAGVTEHGEARARTGSGAASAAAVRIVYPRGDAIARGLAERIAALAWPLARTPDWLRVRLPGGTTAPPAAVPLERDALVDAMGTVHDAIFVVALRHCPAGDPVQALIVQERLEATPLVDARDYLIHRAGVGGVVIDAVGNLRFDTPR